MRQIKSLAIYCASILSLCALSHQALAGREARSEVNFLVPYMLSNTIEFDGGASAEIDEDLGVGFGYAYNYTDNLAVRVDVTWNSGGYYAHRLTAEGDADIAGHLESSSLLFGLDYYFAKGRVAPYVNANVGWTYIDSNISSEPSTQGDCWATPWVARLCKGAKSNYSEKNMVAGFGVGLRFEVARRNFFRVGYYYELVDFDQASDLEGLGKARLEYGFLY